MKTKTIRRIKWAKAIFCPGFGRAYVRLGSQQGVDVLVPVRNQAAARIWERAINKSLARDLQARGYVKLQK